MMGGSRRMGEGGEGGRERGDEGTSRRVAVMT